MFVAERTQTLSDACAHGGGALVALLCLSLSGCSSNPRGVAGAASGGATAAVNIQAAGAQASGGKGEGGASAIGTSGTPAAGAAGSSSGGSTFGASGSDGRGSGGIGGSFGASGNVAASIGGAGASAAFAWTTRMIANPPSYMGSASSGSGCTTPSQTLGFEPIDAAAGKHPLFLYFVGTTFTASDTSARYDSLAAQTVTEAMARRGFVALSVQYDNTLSLGLDKITCVYDASNPASLLAVACKLPLVDCDRGIGTWGHSQGALMAHIASQYEPRVRAVWTTGYSGGSYPLANDRLRVVNGENDSMNGPWDVIKKAAGYAASECPNNGGSDCLRPDGSGFVIVRKQDCITSSADHCWFDRRSCGDNAITLEPNWTDKASQKAFALESNADWVATTVMRP